MSRPRKLHLFNCDRTYKLDAVEELLKVTKAKLGFDSVEKHYFSLAQMSEMTTKTIPNLQMDMAVFVVHAHESRLSINEDNAGIGYAKIYRALLEATGKRRKYFYWVDFLNLPILGTQTFKNILQFFVR
jgi:hypothetical protein